MDKELANTIRFLAKLSLWLNGFLNAHHHDSKFFKTPKDIEKAQWLKDSVDDCIMALGYICKELKASQEGENNEKSDNYPKTIR